MNKVNVPTKICKVCKLTKLLSDFSNAPSNKDGFNNTCKECKRIYSSNYYEINKKKSKTKVNEKQCTNCMEIKEISLFSKRGDSKDSHSGQCKECKKSYLKNYRFINQEEILITDKAYRERNKEKRKIYSKEYNKENKIKIKNYSTQYRIKNPEKAKESRIRSVEKAIKNGKCKRHFRNDAFKNNMCLICYVANNIRASLRYSSRRSNLKKESRTTDIIGCSYEVFCKYIESLFSPGMTWQNQGEWQFDHIKPIATLPSSCLIDEIYELNNYKNFQPLWKEANKLKSTWYNGNKYINGVIVSYENEKEPDWRGLNTVISLQKILK